MQDRRLNSKMKDVDSKLDQLEQLLSTPVSKDPNTKSTTIAKLQQEIRLARQLKKAILDCFCEEPKT